jgi:hypothetical protein
MGKQELAVLFSGSASSMALYVLAVAGRHPDIPQPINIHLVRMQNGALRFIDFPFGRFQAAEKILKAQAPSIDPVPASSFVELDTARLFQELWLNQYEALMPQYNAKNLVCTACALAMHARAVIYCVERLVPLLLVGPSGAHSCCPQMTETFITKAMAFSSDFGITTRFPLNSEKENETVIKHILEDYGLPSDDGGEPKCLFARTLATATEKEIASYLDDMIPRIETYVESRLEGNLSDAALYFTPDVR